jgi:aminoglycoside 6'-N-acetyltransferase I
MKTRKARESDLDVWVALRYALWPDCTLESLRKEARDILASPDEACFLLIEPDGEAVGFVEGAVHPGPNGPYAHVEGWYVVPEHRGKGHGRGLIGEVEQWSLHRGICHLTSDTTPDYPLSPAAHARAGFKTIKEMIIFLKELEPEERNP